LSKRTLTKAEIQEEYQLVKAAQKNRRKFGVLYERYFHPIYIFVFKRVCDEDISGDITSKVFMKAMTKLDSYKFLGLPFSAWLYRIASNEVNQYYRQTNKQRNISADSRDLVGIIDEVTDDEGEKEMLMQQLVATLNQLSPEEVQMVELRFFEKLAFKEIAQVFSITENNAKVRMYRLLDKMKKIMTGDKKKARAQ
jgi:RNA polymerase sigma-70 factor (ECF subfamily)